MTAIVVGGCSDRSRANVLAKPPPPTELPPPAPPWISPSVASPVSVDSVAATPTMVFAVGPIAAGPDVSWALVARPGTDLDAPRASYALSVARSTDGERSFEIFADPKNETVAFQR